MPSVPAIASKPTVYSHCQFRSRLEARWAAMFDLLHWQWVYEPFDLDGWVPDFLIMAHDTILVEIKPILSFSRDVADKMTSNMVKWRGSREAENAEPLLLGLAPKLTASDHLNLCFGWCAERVGVPDDEHPSFAWDDAIAGRWRGSDGDEKNHEGIIGYCHTSSSWTDRITGCYDGGGCGIWAAQDGIYEELTELWNEASSMTQWNGRAARE